VRESQIGDSIRVELMNVSEGGDSQQRHLRREDQDDFAAKPTGVIAPEVLRARGSHGSVRFSKLNATGFIRPLPRRTAETARMPDSADGASDSTSSAA
jgi:hypothetical protein